MVVAEPIVGGEPEPAVRFCGGDDKAWGARLDGSGSSITGDGWVTF